MTRARSMLAGNFLQLSLMPYFPWVMPTACISSNVRVIFTPGSGAWIGWKNVASHT